MILRCFFKFHESLSLQQTLLTATRGLKDIPFVCARDGIPPCVRTIENEFLRTAYSSVIPGYAKHTHFCMEALRLEERDAQLI